MQSDAKEFRLDRRRLLVGSSALALAAAFGRNVMGQDATTFNEWGWPQPYRQISQQSIDWLKSRGWWPLQVGWNPLWSDGNFTLFVMKHYKLLEARGLEVEYKAFQLAPLFNEAFIPGSIQVAQGSSLGMQRLIELNIPTSAVATYSAQRIGLLASHDSPLQSGLADLKDQAAFGRPAVIGAPIGAIVHQALLSGAKVHGLREGVDFVISNVQLEDILAMPEGIDAFCVWEPNVLLMEEFLKTARVVENLDRYLISNGYSYLRGEIEENAPDVVQAYTDAFVEARLLAKARPEESVQAFIDDPSQRGRDPGLIARDAEIHVLNPPPTLNYPFINAKGFWAELESIQTQILVDAGVLRHGNTPEDFESILRPQFLAATFETLGWKVPEQPAFLPPDWTGVVGQPPYPDYGVMFMGKQPFPQTETLTRSWSFMGTTYEPS